MWIINEQTIQTKWTKSNNDLQNETYIKFTLKLNKIIV